MNTLSFYCNPDSTPLRNLSIRDELVVSKLCWYCPVLKESMGEPVMTTTTTTSTTVITQ